MTVHQTSKKPRKSKMLKPLGSEVLQEMQKLETRQKSSLKKVSCQGDSGAFGVFFFLLGWGVFFRIFAPIHSFTYSLQSFDRLRMLFSRNPGRDSKAEPSGLLLALKRIFCVSASLMLKKTSTTPALVRVVLTGYYSYLESRHQSPSNRL